MAVRDEDRVDASLRPGGDAARTPQVGHPVAEQRIGQQPDPVEVDEDRRVPDVLDSAHDRKSASAERSGRAKTPKGGRFAAAVLRDRRTVVRVKRSL